MVLYGKVGNGRQGPQVKNKTSCWANDKPIHTGCYK